MPDFKVYNVLLASLSALVSIILFSLSFSLLSPLDMALKYDSNIHKLDVDTVYGPGRGDGGRFFTGFYIDFMKFPKTLQQTLLEPTLPSQLLLALLLLQLLQMVRQLPPPLLPAPAHWHRYYS